MKLTELGRDIHIDELLPATGTLGTAVSAITKPNTVSGTPSGLSGGQMDPAQAAAAAKERADQKKAIQDQIKATEQQLTDLR